MRRMYFRALIAACFLAAALVASAAADPWVGEWVHHGRHPDAIVIQATAGGYAFSSKGGPPGASLIIPDGKPHKGTGSMSQFTFTCKHRNPHTIFCGVEMGGFHGTSNFELSADGKTLTDTEYSPEMSASSSVSIDADASHATMKEKSSTSNVKMNKSVTAYQKQ